MADYGLYKPSIENVERVRTPDVWPASVLIGTAVSTATLWTPAAGKRFRILGFEFQLPLSTTLAAAGILTQSLLDDASPTPFVFEDYLPNATPANAIGDNHTTIRLPGNGYLSLAKGNVLTVSLSAQLATGRIRWMVFGTEETDGQILI